MRPLRKIAAQREFQTLVFCVSLILFSWPLISWSDLQHIAGAFYYLFGCWSLVILLQLLISRCVESSGGLGEGSSKEH